MQDIRKRNPIQIFYIYLTEASLVRNSHLDRWLIEEELLFLMSDSLVLFMCQTNCEHYGDVTSHD